MEKKRMSADFNHYPSVQKLLEHAKSPLDLSIEENFTPERVRKFQSQSCGFKMLYATEKISEEALESLGSLSEEAHAIEKMEAMQDGEIVNSIEGYDSEKRSVLHTAVRDFFGSPRKSKKASEATLLAKEEWDKLELFLKNCDGFRDMIMIGIGGSDLGPKAVYLALKPWIIKNRRLHFISNIDPDDAVDVLSDIDLKSALVAVISKSGTTLETSVNEEFVRERFRKEGLNPKEHFIAVTGKGSPMDDEERYLKSFYIWDYIGGRFSVSSMVGAVPLAFSLGVENTMNFLKGANAMDKAALERDFRNNLPLLSALFSMWNQNFLACQTVGIIPYSQALSRFTAHIQQCMMESNGKRVDKHGSHCDFLTGPIVWGESGTNAQHSFFQLFHQGMHIVPLEFIGFRESQYGEDISIGGTNSQEKLLANLFAQSISLAKGKKDRNPNKNFPGNRQSHILLGKKLDPFSMGALLAYYEHRVAFQGFIWDINSFDQEGVQLGKVLANDIIEKFEKKRSKTLAQEESDLCLEFIAQLENLL